MTGLSMVYSFKYMWNNLVSFFFKKQKLSEMEASFGQIDPQFLLSKQFKRQDALCE